MAVKVCCIDTCSSSSIREEDAGVTYHKFPKDVTLRTKWIEVTRHNYKAEVIEYVCSRHFCKSDFQIYKDSKYILKSDALPSIFSWTMEDITPSDITPSGTATKMEPEIPSENTQLKADNNTEAINISNESECENLESIKAFIENAEKEISDTKSDVTYCDDVEKTETLSQELDEPMLDVENVDEEVKNKQETQAEKLEVASSVIDMILSESEAKLAEIKDDKPLVKRKICTGEKGNSTPLSVGSKVEAKDFGEYWHPAEIIEVDFDEMEVLVHYEDTTKKHDEWISVSSPRLRPRVSGPSNLHPQQSTPLSETASADTPKPAPPTPVSASTPSVTPVAVVVKEETKDRPKMKFDVGERCLARWRDNRRFIATVNADLGGGQYEIRFDDGVKWICHVIRLSKFKDGSKKDPLTVDTSGNPTTCSTLSPIYGPGPSDAGTVTPNTPQPAHLPFNTHLFDPTRDYLGSKSERREMKRKLNIKEIFNIGQKKKKVEPPPKKIVKPKVTKEKPKPAKKKIKDELSEVKVKKEIPDAVASIIGTVQETTEKPKDVKQDKNIKVKEEKDIKEEVNLELGEESEKLDDTQTNKKGYIKLEVDKTDVDIEVTTLDIDDSKLDMDDCLDLANSETLSAPESQEMKQEDDPALDEEIKLEKFEYQDKSNHEDVIDRMKEVITKLEDGISHSESIIEQLDMKPEIKEELLKEESAQAVNKEQKVVSETKGKKSLSKIKKVKKVRLLQEKRVKNQVEKVQSELEEMRRQVEEMKRKMAEELAKQRSTEMPESFLLPGEWCCKWMNGQPVGTVSEIEHETKVDANNKPVLPRRSVQVVDKRLPLGWTKHMVRRSLGHSAGKWDVVLISPDNRRLHTKTEMKHYLEHNKDESLKPYENALMDFGVHLKLSRRMGWYTTTPDGEQEAPSCLPVGTLSTTSPLVRKKQLSLKKTKLKELKLEKKKKKKKLKLKLKVPKMYQYQYADGLADGCMPGTSSGVALGEPGTENLPLEDGFVYVGSLKVQIIENLLRCPAEGCFKNFRNNTLLKMHIKHYHRELTKQLGATPKVLDLAYARTRPTEMEMRRLKLEAQKNTFRVKLRKLPKKLLEPKPEAKESPVEPKIEQGLIPVREEKVPRSQDSPKLRHALNKPVKRPKVLLPVRRTELSETVVSGTDIKEEECTDEEKLLEPKIEVPPMEALDFETAISTHTVTKPCEMRHKEKRMKFASISKLSEDEDWFGANSDMDTRSSNPRSGTPDSKLDHKLVSSESNEDQKDPNYMYTDTGERIKIVHMKREEIINCHCGFREEDGLMVQCELCFCWQHALCHNIQKESEVPEKYTCSICLNPRRGRRSQRFLHDQDRLYEGLLPGAKPCESLRRSHELSGNLHRIEDALHALRVKYHVATQKNHPKLYLWAKDWEAAELSMTQERLNSDYSDLNIMISSIGKENLPVKPEDIKEIAMELRAEDPDSDRYSQKDGQLGSQALLSGLLSSPGGAALDLPITTTELEKLAKTVQAEQESQRVIIPQPEAAIENSVCRERLLKHIQRCQALIDARLDSIEAQVAELESQDPSFEDDETADFFPRTKQTIQMMMRDLDTMEELGVIT